MKKSICAILAILTVMFGLPWAAVTFADHDAGMAMAFLLFFAIDPAFSLCLGIYSGLAVRRRWFLPAVNGAAFLLGVWTVFDWGNPDFYGYAVAFLAIGLASMLAAAVVRNIRKK